MRDEHQEFKPSKKIRKLFGKALAIQQLMNHGDLSKKDKIKYAGILNKKLDAAWGAVLEKYKWLSFRDNRYSYNSTKKVIYRRFD